MNLVRRTKGRNKKLKYTYTNLIKNVIEENKSLKVLRKSLARGRQIFKPATSQGQTTSSIDEIIQIVGKCYRELDKEESYIGDPKFVEVENIGWKKFQI